MIISFSMYVGTYLLFNFWYFLIFYMTYYNIIPLLFPGKIKLVSTLESKLVLVLKKVV